MSKFFKMFELLEGSRKFLVMIMLLICAILFRVYSYVNGSEFVDLMKGITVAYFMTNISEHIVKVIKDRLELLKKGGKNEKS